MKDAERDGLIMAMTLVSVALVAIFIYIQLVNQGWASWVACRRKR